MAGVESLGKATTLAACTVLHSSAISRRSDRAQIAAEICTNNT